MPSKEGADFSAPIDNDPVIIHSLANLDITDYRHRTRSQSDLEAFKSLIFHSTDGRVALSSRFRVESTTGVGLDYSGNLAQWAFDELVRLEAMNTPPTEGPSTAEPFVTEDTKPTRTLVTLAELQHKQRQLKSQEFAAFMLSSRHLIDTARVRGLPILIISTVNMQGRLVISAGQTISGGQIEFSNTNDRHSNSISNHFEWFQTLYPEVCVAMGIEPLTFDFTPED